MKGNNLMGDKSPKQVQKKNSQQQVKSTKANDKKKQAVASKQAPAPAKKK